MKTLERKTSRKASKPTTTTTLILTDLPESMVDQAEAAAAAQGIDLGEWAAAAMQSKLEAASRDRITITFPPAMTEFITELCGACRISFDDFTQSCLDAIESEVAGTFDDRPMPGILDWVSVVYSEEIASTPRTRKAIEKHRGKFSLMER